MSAGTLSIRSLHQRVGAPGRMAVLLLLVAIVILLMSFRGLGRALLAPSAKEVKSLQDEKIKQLAGEYAVTLTQQAAQFTGRSAFFIPSPPVPPPPPPPDPTPVDDKPPAPPPAPSTYGGPKLIGMINGVAWFDDGQRLQPGNDGKDGLKLKEIKAPWDVAVVWKGVDFDVSLFDRDKVVNPPKKPAKEPAEAAKPEAEAARPEAAKSESPKPGETAPTGSAPAETPPAEAGSAEPKPAEPKPAEPNPAEPKPVEPKPTEPAPGEPKVEPNPAPPIPAPPKPEPTR